ncbi:WEB family protein At4g27595, chloroplastic isoform X2 [Lotus japonicus]|nr:WEB family protein At4g27595, chloroplastic isoform X2 [Lotus japonicus]
MQQHHHLEQYDEKMNQMKEQMRKVEEEKGQAFNDLMEMKKVAEHTNVMVDEVLATKRISDLKNTIEHNNNNIIAASEKIEKGMELDLQFLDKDGELGKLRKEMDVLRSSEENSMAISFDYKRKVQELEAELDKRRESEANLFDTLVMQTKQLEQNKILLEESKLEIASLEEKIKAIEGGEIQIMKIPLESEFDIRDSTLACVRSEIELPKKDLVNMGLLSNNEGEGHSKKAQNLLGELNSLKSELKLATQAEENSKKAMDDLALALKEVATEANQVKAKLTLSQVELEHTKGDVERWRAMLETTEEKYKELLDVTRKEADRFKNTAERLRLEAEESLLAWNGKETEFVNCIRRAEEERLLAQKESNRIVDLLNEVENKNKVSKEENQKLRDILKQALNEANVAKEVAEIAKAENARLQDSLTLLVQENEMLKIHEAASFENIKELKRMLSESSIKEFKNDDIDRLLDKESGKKTKAQHSHSSTEKDSKNLNKTFSFNLKDMITPHNKQQHKVGGSEEANNKETKDDDTLRGSIFDEVDSSDSESRHDEMAEYFDHLDDAPESDRNNRKRRALLRRFGDLIRRKGYHYHQKEPSNEENLQT